MDVFEIERRIATVELWMPFWETEESKFRTEGYGVNYYTPKFYGHNPLTGLPCTVVFNQSSPGRSRVMNWNTLTKCWFYSEDAGLTWKRIETKEDFIKHLDKTDCLMDTEYQPMFE